MSNHNLGYDDRQKAFLNKIKAELENAIDADELLEEDLEDIAGGVYFFGPDDATVHISSQVTEETSFGTQELS